MNDTNEREKITRQLKSAIWNGKIDRIAPLCREYPWLVSDHIYDTRQEEDDYDLRKSWIIFALSDSPESCYEEVIEIMLGLGFNINAQDVLPGGSIVEAAIGRGILVLRFVLSKGADPNFGRPVIGILNLAQKEVKLPMIQLLLDHGLNINSQFELFGDKNKLFTALDWTADPEIKDYLRAHGGKTAAEIRPETALSNASEPEQEFSFAEEVCAYFNEIVGQVSERSQIEIVPTGQRIDIHAIEPGGERKHLTLFTTGLSASAMNVPEGQEDFALAELYIELPGDWALEQLNNADQFWPAFWMRKIARYPHENNTWLGGPLTIIANEEPPEPLAPNIPFTCWMLFVDKSFDRSDGETVKLYRMLPLYQEERALEMQEGAVALLQAFDRNHVPFVVNLQRKNVGLSHVDEGGGSRTLENVVE